ncbi:transcriptional regulator of RNA polII, SAGA, subunit-domain-containing protein [Flagelloscypha sp. PMI_526]|nr:transcriptional regulator of RNA polII, SAGA, subunit-domain-containing protein [Flagelloscypha sp. PMI_526]
MSLPSTASLKIQLNERLGPDQAALYFATLQDYITGKISRYEFVDTVRTYLDSDSLIQLHNTLIVSFFDPRSHKRPLTPPRDLTKPLPPRKRRRILPYQGPDTPDSELTLHSTRLKRWALSLGKSERARVKALQQAVASGELPPTMVQSEEISAERGIALIQERGDPPGSRLPVNLLATSNATSLQHISDKINLVAAQNNLANPNRNVATLMQLALEMKLKQILGQAISLTASSDVIESIHPSEQSSLRRRRDSVHLDSSAFESLTMMNPSILPNGSSAMRELRVLGPNDPSDGDPDKEIAFLRDQELNDPRWQIVALLGQRSTVKDALRSVK